MENEKDTRQYRIQSLREALKKQILVMDGALGTRIQALNPRAEDFGGASFEGCNEVLVEKRPEWIKDIHSSYLEAGADIIETNSFGGTPLVLKEFGLAERALELNEKAARLAREVAQKYSTGQKTRFVAGSIGPTTKAISLMGGISFDNLVENFFIQVKGLFQGGVDFFLVETCQDTLNIKAALVAVKKLSEQVGYPIPAAVSGTIESTGTMLAGQTVEAMVASLSHFDLLFLGLNCATGPEFMTEHIRSLAAVSPFPVSCMPNAGLPDEEGRYLETPAMFSRVLEQFVNNGWINLVGGCCGTTTKHISELFRMVRGRKPRGGLSKNRSFLSGLECLEVTDEVRPVLVGERCNVIGSKKFKDLIKEEKYEEAAEIGKAQVKNGAQVLDVCLANPDRREAEDMEKFLDFLVKKIKVPLMIDSTDAEVVEIALKRSQGKAIINSINLEDGEERFERLVPLAKKYGAAFVVGTIDDDPEQGMGIHRQRKLEIAERSCQLLVGKYHFPVEDIYWDPLVFPCGTGDEKYHGSAVETIEGIKLLKNRFPESHTVLGISNVSFGLPTPGRRVLNSVFLYHAIQAGLDMAIVSAQSLDRYAQIQEQEKTFAEDLLFARHPNAISAFVAYFRDKKENTTQPIGDMSLDERLSRHVIEGTKDGLIVELELKLKEALPIEIINGPLMAGMDEVGRLFNDNKLIVVEVLQSAEVMKAAVTFLEPKMGQASDSSRGKVILATVKGDVHDIGKNLVDIILSNNGFEVIDLGIRVPSEQLIQAIHDKKPDVVGLSGLLVKSAHQMVATASDFAKAGISTPILVGGAALSSSFVDRKIAKAYEEGTVAYASDAMQGLDLARTIVDPVRFERLKQELAERRQKLEQVPPSTGPEKIEILEERSKSIDIIDDIPQPIDFEKHVLIGKTPIEEIWQYLNPMMLYGRHLGVRGVAIRLLQDVATDSAAKREIQKSNPKAYATWELVEAVKNEYRQEICLRPSTVFQFFKVSSEGNKIHFYSSDGNKPMEHSAQKSHSPESSQHALKPHARIIESLVFPRMDKDPHACLSDYVHSDSAKNDNMALFTVTVGRGIRELALSLKSRGDYLTSHIIQALALESAEAYAEFIHAYIRRVWGFSDRPSMTMLERFQAKYRGKRYSFGYPACPQLADQRILFRLLRPEEIGVELTEGHMMDPEASVSALVFHHPQATYFSVGRAVVEEKNAE